MICHIRLHVFNGKFSRHFFEKKISANIFHRQKAEIGQFEELGADVQHQLMARRRIRTIVVEDVVEEALGNYCYFYFGGYAQSLWRMSWRKRWVKYSGFWIYTEYPHYY